MRLLIISPEYDSQAGGIATFYRALLDALRQEDVKIRLIEGSAVHAANDRALRTYDGIQVETLETQRLARWHQQFSALGATPRLRAYLAAAWAMWEQVDFGRGADVVEATDWGLLFVPPAVEANRPLVVHCHGSVGQIAEHDPVAGQEAEDLILRLIEKDVLTVAGVVQTHSRANAAFWRAETGRHVAITYPAYASPSAARCGAVGDRGLAVGRLQRWKGPDILCQALRRLGSSALAVDWYGRDTVWGTRDCYTSAQLARMFPDVWGTKFYYHNQIQSDEVIQRQSSALFNVVPSTWDVYNFSVVEAMASGRPTIVSTGAGASELIEDGVNGFLFANGDAEALAQTIQRLLNENPARLAEIGRQGRNTVRKSLDPETIATRRVTAYSAAIDAFKKQRSARICGWLGEACRPSQAVVDDMGFLENLPLRALAKHVAARIARKVGLR